MREGFGGDHHLTSRSDWDWNFRKGQRYDPNGRWKGYRGLVRPFSSSDYLNEGRSNRCYTLFVSNLPESIHWKGLFACFNFHGNVMDAFIPNKKAKDGKRFGFVRYGFRADAERALERLDGFHLFGSKIRVSMARFNVRTNFWRKKKAISNRSDHILGVVDDSKINVLRNSIVGWCKLYWKVDELAKEMQDAGLQNFSVMRLSDSVMLLVFRDSANLELAKKEYWSTLDNWFDKKEDWTSSLNITSRRVWVSVYGVPVHAWCLEMFKHLVSKWGMFISMDDDTADLKVFTKGNVQIITECLERIEEVVTLDVDGKIFTVRISEVDPLLLPNLRCQCEYDHLSSDSSSDEESKNSDPSLEEENNKVFSVQKTSDDGDGEKSVCDESVSEKVAADYDPLDCPVILEAQKSSSSEEIVPVNVGHREDGVNGSASNVIRDCVLAAETFNDLGTRVSNFSI